MQYNNEVIVSTDVKVLVQNGVWFNATNMVDGFNKENGTNKRLDAFWVNDETIEYVEDLVEELQNSNSHLTCELKDSNSRSERELKTELYKQTKRGRYGGTYIHPELAIVLARYLSPKFGRACDKVVQKVMQDGYYISNNLNNKQANTLVKEVRTKYERIFIDGMRKELIDNITNYLGKFGYSDRQTSALISSMYNDIHLGVQGKVATQIVYDVLKEGMTKDSIQTVNQLRKTGGVFKTDYHSAINYYDQEQLDTFGEYFEMCLRIANAHIKNKRRVCTPELVRNALVNESKRIARDFSGFDIGDVIEGVSRDKLNEVIDVAFDLGFILSEEEKEEYLRSIDNARSRSYVVS